MNLDTYQTQAATFAIYPSSANPLYPLTGLMSEVGEVADLIKKSVRPLHNAATTDEVMNAAAFLDRDEMRSELGDCLWYLAALASAYGLTLTECARENLGKLRNRQATNTLHSR